MSVGSPDVAITSLNKTSTECSHLNNHSLPVIMSNKMVFWRISHSLLKTQASARCLSSEQSLCCGKPKCRSSGHSRINQPGTDVTSPLVVCSFLAAWQSRACEDGAVWYLPCLVLGSGSFTGGFCTISVNVNSKKWEKTFQNYCGNCFDLVGPGRAVGASSGPRLHIHSLLDPL